MANLSNQEREMLRQSIRALVTRFCPLDQMGEAAKRGNNPTLFMELNSLLAEQGALQMGSDTAYGGWLECCAILEEIGRLGATTSVVSAILTNLALRENNDTEQLITTVWEGKSVLSWVLPLEQNSTKLTQQNDGYCGNAECVEHAVICSHVAVLNNDSELLIFKRDDEKVSIATTPSLSYPDWSSVAFNNARPVFKIKLQEDKFEQLRSFARLAKIAQALGATERGFELVTDYAKERHQFGQPIGRFQAVQHKLANNAISIAGVRKSLESAAIAYDTNNPDWYLQTLAAYTYASTALRQVALENHHVFGAIGYSEEHEVAHQFKHIHTDSIVFDSPLVTSEALGSLIIEDEKSLPDYDLGETGNAKHEQIRHCLKTRWASQQDQSEGAFRQFLGKENLISFAWPKAYGGSAATPMEEMALLEAIEEANAPETGYFASQIQAHALIHFGSDTQKAHYLPKLATGEISFCLGYSEPGSGSDLASLRTTATLDGDEWVINGEKIWTTLAETSDYIWLAARTDPQANVAHAGISIFIVPMNAEGITVRPSMALYGKTFCHEFLDNVRIPKENLVGELNGGWKILMAALAIERAIMGGYVSKVRQKFNFLCSAIRADKKLASSSIVKSRVGILAAEIETSRRLYLSCLEITEKGGVPILEAAISGVFTSELMERLGEAALDILGPKVLLSKGSDGSIPGDLEQMLRHSIMLVVGGGTNEIQRNLIAQRGLQLPR